MSISGVTGAPRTILPQDLGQTGKGGSSAAPQDTLQTHTPTAPPPLSVADIRRIVATKGKSGDDRVRVETLPFGVEIELEGFDRSAAQTMVDNFEPWTVKPNLAKWSMVHDGSVPGSGGGSGGEAVSPPMVLEGGRAEAEIRAVLQGLKELGGRPSMACGLHVHVDASRLGARGMANLMKMALEQEQALFRLSQNGQPQHRGARDTSNPFHYCRPLGTGIRDAFPLIHADSVDEFRNAFYTQLPAHGASRPALPAVGSNHPFTPDRRDPARYYDVNFNSYWFRGTVEFRIFNATDDPEKFMDDVRLALGMVAAATNDDYTFLKPDTLMLNKLDDPVSREAFQHFLEKTVPDPATRERLTRTFSEGGGTFIDESPVEGSVAHAARLIERGIRFEAAEKPVISPFEVVNELQTQKRHVTVHTPTWSNELKSAADLEAVHDALDQELSTVFETARQQGHRFTTLDGHAIERWNGLQPMTLTRADGAHFALSTLESERMLAAVGGRPDLLDVHSQARLAHTAALAEQDVRFCDVDGNALNPAEAAVLSETDGRVIAVHGEESVPIGHQSGQLRLIDLRSDQANNRFGKLIPDLTLLAEHGVRFRHDGRVMQWAPRIAQTLSAADTSLQVTTPAGHSLDAHSAADLNPLLVDIRRAELQDDERARYTALRDAAREANMTFSTAGQTPAAADSADEMTLLLNPATPLEATVPGLGRRLPLADRAQIPALASVAAMVGSPIAPVLFRHVVPLLVRDTARAQVDANAPRELSGQITVNSTNGPTAGYRVTPVAGHAAVDVQALSGNAARLRFSLEETADASPSVRVEREQNGVVSNILVDPRMLVDGTVAARHEVGRGLEVWSALDGDQPVQAVFHQAVARTAPPAEASGALGIDTRGHFQEIAGEKSTVQGFRVTNEVSTAFPKFTLRGGAYLGVGASQNYDHLTTVRADMVFLTDADPRVSADHRGVLALVGQSRNAGHFLSMLMGTRLSADEENLPLNRIFELITRRGPDKNFAKETQDALGATLSAESLGDVTRVQKEARSVFLETWKRQAVSEKQHRWLWEPERFAHLRFLQNSGRVIVRCASVTGPETMASIASHVESWNKTHYPPLSFSAVYLSNAEQWISSGNQQTAAYPTLVAHLNALPLHPDGVIIRTGGTDLGGVQPTSGGNAWYYASLPMAGFQAASRNDTSYAGINRATASHRDGQENAQNGRAQQIMDTVLASLEAGGVQIDGGRTIGALRDGAVTLRTAQGQIMTPRSFDSLLRTEKLLNGHDQDIAPGFADLHRAFNRLGVIGYRFTNPKTNTAIGDPLALWETLEEGPVELRNHGRSMTLRSADSLIDLGRIETGHFEELDGATRQTVEALQSLADAGCRLQSSHDITTMASAYESFTNNQLVVTLPFGKYVHLKSDEQFSEEVSRLRAQALKEGETLASPAFQRFDQGLTRLQERGVKLRKSKSGGALSDSVDAWKHLAANGTVRLEAPGSAPWDVKTPQALTNYALMLENLGADLDADVRAHCDALHALQEAGYVLGGSAAPLSIMDAWKSLCDGNLSMVSPMGGTVTVQHGDELLAHLQDGLARAADERAQLSDFQSAYDTLVNCGWTFSEQTTRGKQSALSNADSALRAAQRGALRGHRGDTVTSALLDVTSGWPRMRAIIGDRSALKATDASRLDATEKLFETGATATAGQTELTPAETLVVAEPTFHLNKAVRWGVFPRKTVNVRNDKDLLTLAARACQPNP